MTHHTQVSHERLRKILIEHIRSSERQNITTAIENHHIINIRFMQYEADFAAYEAQEFALAIAETAEADGLFDTQVKSVVTYIRDLADAVAGNTDESAVIDKWADVPAEPASAEDFGFSWDYLRTEP